MFLRHGWYTHDQLDSIAKGRVEQTAEGFAELRRKLLGCKRETGSQGDDGQEVENEDGRWAPVRGAGDKAKRNKDQ